MIERAKWIRSPEDRDEACFEFYKRLHFEKKIRKATLCVTAMGLYKAYINGKAVSDALFTPYFTSYNKRLQYQTYDVTELLRMDTDLSILAAEGWAVGNLVALPGVHHRYSDHIAVKFAVEVEFEGGEVLVVLSDESVGVRNSHILSSSIYNGEVVDKTLPIRELGRAVLSDVSAVLLPQEGAEVHEQEIVYPSALITTPKGEKVIDFGQNMVGYVELTVTGKPGDRIVMSHGEILDKDGNFYNDNLRTAMQRTEYVLAGEENEVLKPTFSWQGFRYVRLDEFPLDKIDLASFCGIVVYSDMERSSYFTCGNDKINRLYSNILWGQKGNFVDIPTDCPQRDERLGWTGDAQIFVRTAAINFDVEKIFKKWLRDLVLEQGEDGIVGLFVPYCNLDYPGRAVAAWGDAVTICPWEIYLAYGDREMLEECYPSMKKWVDFVRREGDEEFLWLGGGKLGDWLALDDEKAMMSRRPTKGNTDPDFIASAFFAYSTSLLIRAGRVLEKDVSEYECLLENIKSAIRKRFFEDRVPKDKTQTAYALALRFGLCEDAQNAGDILARLVRANGNRLTTGFVATPHLLHALSESGHSDTAYDLLLQESFPSWLYSVNNGATTSWEHWDGIREDGSVWDKDMNSYNHYAYGAVGDWLFGACAGIKCLDDGAGYKHIALEPHTDKRLGFVKYEIGTRSGRLSSAWRYITDSTVRFEFEIPSATVAELALPNGAHYTLGGGKHTFFADT
jgi:alpha-L-rhamnosidase